jgi:hypothetical protein
MEDSIGFFQARQVYQKRIEVARSQCSFHNRPHLHDHLIQSLHLPPVVLKIFLFDELVVKIIKAKIFEGIPSLQKYLVVILGKRI